MNPSNLLPFLSHKYLDQLKNQPLNKLAEGKFGKILIKSEKCMTTPLIDSLKNPKSIDSLFDIKNSHLLEFMAIYKKHLRRDTCMLCNLKRACEPSKSFAKDGNNHCSQYDFLFNLVCEDCSNKAKQSKDYIKTASLYSHQLPILQYNVLKPDSCFRKVNEAFPESPNCFYINFNCLDHNHHSHKTLLEFNKCEENLYLYWSEVRNSIYQIFLQEGFLINSVVEENITSPLLKGYVMPSDEQLKFYVKKLFKSNKLKLVQLIICHTNLFIMEIKLRLLKSLMGIKPFFIFPLFYACFQRLLRALKRTSAFLGLIETEFLQQNHLQWYSIHLLTFQTFVYMNRFIQKSILLLCDCSTEMGFKTNDDEDSRLVGQIVEQTYMILEQNMCSFSIISSDQEENLSLFYSTYDDFQLLFRIAIILFNSKSIDEMFPNQKLNDAGNARSLQEMPNFDMDLLIRDAFNTIMYQLFLVMHNWENASMFDNVTQETARTHCLKLSRKTIKKLLSNFFRFVGYNKTSLMNDFLVFIGQEESQNYKFDDLLAEEFSLSDEERDEEEDDDDSVCSDSYHNSYFQNSSFNRNYHENCDCDCCFSEVMCNASRSKHSKHFSETRERLRQRLSKRKLKLLDFDNNKDSSCDCSTNQEDDRNLDDLLNFINGDDCDKKGKKAKKNKSKEMTNESSQSKSKKKKNKKHKHKEKSEKSATGGNSENKNHTEKSLETNSNGRNLLSSPNENHYDDDNHYSDEEGNADCDSVPNEETINDDSSVHSEDNFEDQQPNQDTKESDESNSISNEVSDDTNLAESADDVFKPQDIDLDNNDLDEFEIQLEMFKRFCYYNSNRVSCKPKLILDVKDIFAKRV